MVPETYLFGGFLSAKLGSDLGQLSAENGVKPRSETQNQAKRINEIVFPWLLRDQGVGGSNPLSPINHSEASFQGTCGP